MFSKFVSGAIEMRRGESYAKLEKVVREGIVLGHLVFEHGIKVDNAKIEVIEKLQLPSLVKGVRIF